jgi:hypothetical protein
VGKGSILGEVATMDYEITVKGTLDAAWTDWFSGMTITIEEGRDGGSFTILNGWIHDQSALRGMLNKLWDLNLTLLSVICWEYAKRRWDCDDAQ